MGHQAGRGGEREGSMIGTRYRHMTEAMQARVVAVIAERLAVALAFMPQVCLSVPTRFSTSVLLSTQIAWMPHGAAWRCEASLLANCRRSRRYGNRAGTLWRSSAPNVRGGCRSRAPGGRQG